MGKIAEKLREVREHHNERRLTKQVQREYADDPDVEFVYSAPVGHDAPHGVNTPEEMTYSAEPVTD